MTSDSFSVGHAYVAVDIPIGTPLGGYAARTGPSTGTLDAAEVHAVTVSNSGSRFVWIVADLPAVNTDLADAVATRICALPGIRPELVWLGATHTHSSADTGCRPGGGKTPVALTEMIVEAAYEAVEEAVRVEEPGQLTVHKGLLTGVGGQRSGPSPRGDVPVTVLTFRTAAGSVRGLITVLPVHPTVLSAENRLVSADLAGAVRRALAADGRWAMVATGAAGDMSTRPHRREQSPGEVGRLGATAANQLLALAESAGLAVDAAAPTAARTIGFPLPSRDSDPAPDLDSLHARYLEAKRSGNTVSIREAETAVQGAELSATARPAEPRLTISTVRLGQLRLIAFGAEPFLDLEQHLADALADPVALVGYTHGYLGYLPIESAYKTDVYEVNISPVAAGAAESAVTEAVRLTYLI